MYRSQAQALTVMSITFPMLVKVCSWGMVKTSLNRTLSGVNGILFSSLGMQTLVKCLVMSQFRLPLDKIRWTVCAWSSWLQGSINHTLYLQATTHSILNTVSWI